MNRITDAPLPLGVAHETGDSYISLELAELLDDVIEVLRREIGESVNDLFLIQTHWMRDRQEFRINVYPTFEQRWRWQAWDRDCVLDSMKSQVQLIREHLGRVGK